MNKALDGYMIGGAKDYELPDQVKHGMVEWQIIAFAREHRWSSWISSLWILRTQKV